MKKIYQEVEKSLDKHPGTWYNRYSKGVDYNDEEVRR